ncbi:MAG: hypothetical protein U0800_06535 [Isosphaeraceae bacterium]
MPIRGLLYTLTANPFLLVGIQLLDGIGAGIFGVVSVLVVADLTRGTGRFNLTQGAMATATGIGAALSNLLTGYIVKRAGFDAGFLGAGRDRRGAVRSLGDAGDEAFDEPSDAAILAADLQPAG